MSTSNSNRSNSRGSRLREKLPQGSVKGAAAVAGVAAAAGAAYYAYKRYASNGTVTTLHVRPYEDGWILERDGSSEPEERFATKAEAVDAGRALAHKKEPSELFVYRTDGTVERQHSYGDTT